MAGIVGAISITPLPPTPGCECCPVTESTGDATHNKTRQPRAGISTAVGQLLDDLCKGGRGWGRGGGGGGGGGGGRGDVTAVAPISSCTASRWSTPLQQGRRRRDCKREKMQGALRGMGAPGLPRLPSANCVMRTCMSLACFAFVLAGSLSALRRCVAHRSAYLR